MKHFPGLDVQNVHKSLHGKQVLQGVSFTADKGNVLALLGQSGSGKSTLLRCINQLTIPDGGTIRIGQEVHHFTKPDQPRKTIDVVQLRQKVGMVFQQFNLWAHMTVLQNLIVPPIYVLKKNKEETVATARRLLNKVGLAHLETYYPAQLSGGQQQRAAIARALMMDPEIMLFDEPTSALDPEMVREVVNAIQALAKEGMTIVVATHELAFAKRVADHVMFLSEGRITEQGCPDSIFHAPKTEPLKKFLEAMQY